MQGRRIEAIIASKFGNFKRIKGKKGTEYLVKCPKCGKRKLYINPNVGAYICHKGCMSGNVKDLIDGPISVTSFVQPQPQALKTTVAMPGNIVPLHTLSSDHVALRYLRERELDVEELDYLFGVMYCARGRMFGGIFNTSNTIIFPLWMNDMVVGWQARLLYDPKRATDDQCKALGYLKDEDNDWVRPPKYFTSPGVEKGRVLFNFDVAKTSDIVVICEGPVDAIAVGACGVATLGKGVTSEQTQLIKAHWDAAIILLDPGDADKDMAELEAQLLGSIPAIRVDLQGYKDAGEAPRKEIWRQIGKAMQGYGFDISKYKLRI